MCGQVESFGLDAARQKICVFFSAFGKVYHATALQFVRSMLQSFINSTMALRKRLGPRPWAWVLVHGPLSSCTDRLNRMSLTRHNKTTYFHGCVTFGEPLPGRGLYKIIYNLRWGYVAHGSRSIFSCVKILNSYIRNSANPIFVTFDRCGRWTYCIGRISLLTQYL